MSDKNLVMVMPGEIELLAEGTGRPADCFCEPYPESLATGGRRQPDFRTLPLPDTGRLCLLLGELLHRVPVPPLDLPDHPFMLDGDELAAFPCEGLGQKMTREAARDLALLLIRRKEAEREEEEAVERVLASARIPEGAGLSLTARG